MARDEKEREKRKRDDRESEGKEVEDKRQGGLVTKHNPGELTGRIRPTNPRSLHETHRNDSERHFVLVESAKYRPRDVASTERLTRSFKVASGNTHKAVAREKAVHVGKSRAPPIPPAWKPTPTKTSILREAAVKSAKDAKLKATAVKTIKNKSPTRSAGFSFPKASPSRSLASLPEKGQQFVVDDDKKHQSLLDCAHEAPKVLSTENSNASMSFEVPGNNISWVKSSKGASTEADPIFAIRSPFGQARRLQPSSTENTGRGYSDWSTDTYIPPHLTRPNTPQSPSTTQHEEFSPYFDPQAQSRTIQIENSPQFNTHQRTFIGRTRSPLSFGSDRLYLHSGRLLASHPPLAPDSTSQFELSESDDEYGHEHGHGLKKPSSPTSSRYATLPSRYTRLRGLGNPSQQRAPRTSFNTISCRSRTPNESSTVHETLRDEERSSLKVKPILTISRGECRRRNQASTRESIKSVRWDPAIIAVGRQLDPTDESQPENSHLASYEPEDNLTGFTVDDYLKTVTQSFAKLKKTNPKVIGQLLAALRDLKSDDESNTDTEPKKKLRSNPRPLSEDSLTRADATKNNEKEITSCELLRSPDQSNFIKDKLASVIERMKRIRLSDESGVFKQSKVKEGAKKDKRWGEVHPSIFHNAPSRVTTDKVTPEQEAKAPISIDHVPQPPKRTPIDKGSLRLVHRPSPSKLNPQAPSFRDFSVIKPRTQAWSHEENIISHKRAGCTLNLSLETGFNVIRPALQTDWRLNSQQPGQRSISPRKTFPESNEVIWVNTSQLPVAENHDLEDIRADSTEFCSHERNSAVSSIFTQPHIFTVPPGFIPLVPGYQPQAAPYQPTYPQAVSLPPGLPLRTTLERNAIQVSKPSVPSEDEYGRVSQRLHAAWTERILAGFQAKYPLTGTRNPESTAAAIDLETLTPPCLVPTQLSKAPRSKPPMLQPPRYHVRDSIPFIQKTRGNSHQIAKKTRASVIQQALEIKILEFKEKKAAETKELQKKEIEKVAKMIPLIRQQEKMQISSVDPDQSLIAELSRRQPSVPDWKRMIEHSSDGVGHDLAHQRGSELSEDLIDLSSGITPEHVWEYLSMEESNSRALARAHGLAQMETDTSSLESTPVAENVEQNSSTNSEQVQDLLHANAISRSSSSTTVATYYVTPGDKSWEVHSVEEWHGQASDGFQQSSRPGKSEYPWINLSSSEWRRQAVSRSRALWPGETMSEAEVITHPKLPCEQLRNMASIEEIRVCDSAASTKLDQDLRETRQSEEEVLPEDQAATIRSAWEVLSVQEWQAKSAGNKEANPTSAAIETLSVGLDRTPESPIAALSKASLKTSKMADSGWDNPWELLTVEEWERQASGKSHGATAFSHTPETGSDTQFKAPKYLWDFLDLEFKLDDLQNLGSIARQSSRSGSMVSEALSDTLIEARRRLSLSQPKHRAVEAQNFSETSSATVLSGSSLENGESQFQQVQLNFDWVPQSLRTSTVDISLDSSEILPEGLSEGSRNSRGNLLALAEGSAAEESSFLMGQSIESFMRVVSRSPESIGVQSEFGDGGERDMT